MVRPPHLPPIGDEEAKRKWELMNRPSISRLHLQPKRSVNSNNFVPTYNPRTYNKKRRNNKRSTSNNHYDKVIEELGSITAIIIFVIIALTLLVFFWWIILPLAILIAIYMITKKN